MQRRSNRAAEKRRKRRRRRTWVTVLLALTMISLGVFGAWIGIRPVLESLTAPNDYPGPGSGTVTVKIADGASGKAIGATLQTAGVVKSVKAFVAALSADPKSANAVHPGTYTLRREMSSTGALAALVDRKNALTASVTVPEGLRLDQILPLLTKQLKLDPKALQAATKAPNLGLPADAKGNVEGLLFPATYAFEKDVTALEVLQTMVKRTVQTFDELKVAEDQRRRVLIEASLVQAEAGRAEDFGKVAKVLDNRIEKGINLQLDTTVHYATKNFRIFTTNEETRFPSPYNTYLHPGLPPGPIVAPGEQAIRAVLNPTPGEWLFFTTTDPSTGETKFANSDAERQSHLTELKAWQKAHPGQ